MHKATLPDRIGLLADRLYESERERSVIFKESVVAMCCWLHKEKLHRLAFSPDGEPLHSVLVTMTDREVGKGGPMATFTRRIDSGKVMVGDRPYPPQRLCFVCQKTKKDLTWTNLPLVRPKVPPRARLVMFTCSEACAASIRNVSPEQ